MCDGVSPLPHDSIKEIYFGLRSEDDASDDLYDRATKAHKELNAYQCQLTPGDLHFRQNVLR